MAVSIIIRLQGLNGDLQFNRQAGAIDGSQLAQAFPGLFAIAIIDIGRGVQQLQMKSDKLWVADGIFSYKLIEQYKIIIASSLWCIR